MSENPRAFSAEGRRANLEDLAAGRVDVLVIGGGITGAGVALQAANRGFTVGLVDSRDFAAGTSSRSSKLVHGGFRYLRQGEVGLVREALQERKALTRLYPDLVKPLSFLLTIPPRVRQAVPLKVGLMLYDLLAADGGYPRHRRVGVEEARRMAPALNRTDIRGAWQFYDGQTDDTRLTLRILAQAMQRGTRLANYAAVTSARADGDGWTVSIKDGVSGDLLHVRARFLVNATGVWAEEIEGMAGGTPRFHLRPSKGVHLSIAADALRLTAALVFPTGDGRLLFALPWHGYTLVGTTDADYQGDIASPGCTPEEEADLLGAVNRFFGLELGPESVRSRWAGVRPWSRAGTPPRPRTSAASPGSTSTRAGW